MDKLGEGTYGLVYRAHDLQENKIVAIKKIKLDRNEEGIPATTLREVSLLKHLKHPNIVEMSGVLYDEGDLFLVFEFVNQDLKGYIDDLPRGTYPSAKTVKRFTYFLTEGIRHCHARRVLHRDLKPQNILISDDGELKIADFGLGREHGLPINELTHEVVTLWYRPPEILLGKQRYSGSADVWGIACIMAEMATKIPLFTGDSEIDQLFQIYKIMGTPNPETWPGIEALPAYKPVGPKWRKKDLAEELEHKVDADGLDLLEKALCYPPNQRITAKQMLLHRYFDEIREEMVAIFGRKFPHCGSPEYQRARHRGDEQKIDEEDDDDVDYVDDIEGDDEEDEEEDTDLDEEELHSDSEEEENEDDDDDDIEQNANRWREQRAKKRQRREDTASQPMEEDE